ncbi:hypothetical protein TPA0910_44550 [Streptomyces hygroscopicus subsp. sporocinereus]|uniref:Integral membrane protein n=1 Tax=Streptomyces hygroscopicus TaxID=1912 RepID=A0ABQ3U341_STRHY|nr:hypothetical protein [Streptomyces hygroscopicus]GHJ30022.1 hypothetical protein TPA0910_44550 [Streptomyces hygroscopicus]
MKRLVSLLLALIAAVAMTVGPAPSAVADEGGPIDFIGEFGCEAVGGGLIGPLIGKNDLCDKVGDKTEKAVEDAWNSVWDSVLGDVITAAKDVTKWIIKKVLTVALMGPSVDLAGTGLFGRDATLAGMLVWLGWVIAAFGLMWQLGRMAVTGQSKYAGQALAGWVQNAMLTASGVAIVAVFLRLGDAMTTGLVNKSFDNSGNAYKQIVAVLIPKSIQNPVMVLGVVSVLLLVGFAMMIMIFLRQSAIPIQCLLLPIAGAGRVGGETTRQWAPRLITSIFVVIAYKPIVAIIICTGFTEFGKAHTLAEWLRGVATLVLAVLAPGPLTKLFAPLGAEIGAGLASGGALGAAASVGGLVGRGGDGGQGGDGDSAPTNAVQHAQHVAQTMPRSYQDDHRGGSGDQDTPAQGVPPQHGAGQQPKQAGAADAATGAGAGTAGAGASAGAGGAGAAGGASASGAAAAGAGPAGLAIQVLDGVSDALQGASGQIGDGGDGGKKSS